jgi:acetyl esterase/lipase
MTKGSDSEYPPELARLTVPDGPYTKVPYGDGPDQFGELWLRPGAAAVVLVHGGFWRERYRLDIMHALADDLWLAGYTVWNLEYRRVGGPGGGWPGTLCDVASGFDALAGLAVEYGFDVRRVPVVGHSAGGHLALWLAARGRLSGTGWPAPRLMPSLVVGLATVGDLGLAHRLNLSDGAASAFVGAPPEREPGRYRQASPVSLLPLGCPQLLVHGTGDDSVPFSMSERYVEAARAAGGPACELIALPGTGHLELIDPATAAWRAVRAGIDRASGPRSRSGPRFGAGQAAV